MKNIFCEVNQFFFWGKRFSFLFVYMCVAMASMGQEVKWALVDTKTTEPFHDGIACFGERKVGYGGIDRNGKVVIQPIYDDSFSFKNGAAIVSLKGKNGIINVAGVYLLKPEYKYIREQEEAKGLYEVIDSVGNKGLFFNNRLILPCKYKYLSTYLFPIISVTEQNGSNYYVNIMNGSIYKYCAFQGNLLIVVNKGITDYYLKKSGEQINPSLLSKSSKGLEVYYEEETKMYGLKNGKTGQIVAPPRYFKNGIKPVWYHDVMILRTDTIPDAVMVMLDANGNEIIRGQEGQTIFVIDDKYVWVSDKFSLEKENCMGLYTIDGKVILPVKYYAINPLMKDWFIVTATPLLSNPEFKLFNAKSKRFYDNTQSEYYDGMLRMLVKKGEHYNWGFMDLETGYEIPAKYTSATHFSGGLAIVTQDGKTFAIDKRGNMVLSENDRFSFRNYRSDGFSEGVVGAYDKVSNTNGYIYNPLGSEGYTYNSTGTASDETIWRWMSEGGRLFDAKNYVNAKDYYYRVLMSDPSKVDALSGYAACLNNMGYYDEAIEAYQMALDIDPNNSFLKNNLQNSLGNKHARETKDEMTEDNSSKSGTFWDALSSFCSVLGNMMGSSTTYTYENSFSNGDSNYGSGSSTGNASSYRNEYARWEQRAQANYQSLTNSGYSVRQSNGNRKGGTLQGMNGGNYVQMKKALRDAQREMRNIRQRAQKNGITIAQSSWENATVSY